MTNTEREGVSAVQNIVYRELKWFFREQTVDDYGIDAQLQQGIFFGGYLKYCNV